MTLNIDRRQLLVGAAVTTVAATLPDFAWALGPGDPRPWINIGEDRAYQHRPIAIADVVPVLRNLERSLGPGYGWPDEVIRGFQQDTRNQGTPDHLRPGDTFDWMRSGEHGEIWGRPDPHGRYGRGVVAAWDEGIEVVAEKWTRVLNNDTYFLWLPRICYNFCGKKVPAPPQAHRPCPEQHIYVKAGQTVHMGWLSNGPLPRGECELAFKQPGRDWGPMPSQCRRNCDFAGTVRDGRLPGRRWPFSGLAYSWVADVDGVYIVRMPMAITNAEGEWAFCLFDTDGRQSLSSFIEANEYPLGIAHLTFPDIQQHISAAWKRRADVNTWQFRDD